MSDTSIKELLFTAIEFAAAAATYDEFEDARRGTAARTLDSILDPDDLDLARNRVGGARWRLKRFFESLDTDDVHALAVIYWTSRDTHGYDDRDPRRDLLSTLNHVTRNASGSAEKARETCLRKLKEVGAANLVREFARAFGELTREAEEMRSEFSDYQAPA